MFKTLLAATTVAAFALPAQAVTVVAWDFEALPSALSVTGASYSVAASSGTGTASGVHAAATTVFSSPAGNGTARSLSANTWAVGDYWQFSFSTVGFTGLSVSFDQTGSNTGPANFAFAYSTNGGSSFTTFSTYTVAVSTWTAATPMAGFTTTLDLAAIPALNNNASVVVRLVDTTTTSINGTVVAAGGTDRVDNFVVSASPVPEPGTYALLLAGLGAVGFVAARRRA